MADPVQEREPTVSAYEILKVIAHKVAKGESITIAPDWGLGSGTLVFQDGSHTHFGCDIEDDERKAVDDFIQGLHGLLVEGSGLSLCPGPPPAPVEFPGCDCPECKRGHMRQEVPGAPFWKCDNCGHEAHHL